MAKPTKDNRKSVVDFGVGWVVIIYCLLMFFLYVGMCNDGANITAPNVAYRLGLEQGDIMNMNSLAGLVGVVFFIIAGQVNRKIGARMTSGICCIISGIAYILACNAPSIVIYTVCMCFVYGGIMSAGYVAGGTLVASWFPKKKGVVMGYTTMGHNFASAFYVQLVAILIAPTVAGTTNIGENFSTGIVPIGIAAIVLGILGMIFIRNEPWERGINPDNVSDEIYQKEYDTKDAVEGDGGWTTGKLLATKELWLAAITTGFFQICSVGVMSQLVIRNTQLGFSQQAAMNVMTILALGGVVGSWLVGVIDDAIGTKKTMVMFGIWYAIALLLNFTAVDSVTPLVYVSLFMIAMGIGGSANFTTSLPTSIFGRQGFDKVNSVIFPIQGAVTALCFLVNGVVQKITGGQIRIGASDTICRYFLVPYLERFHKAFPNAHIKVTNATSIKCTELLENGQVDLIVANYPNVYLGSLASFRKIRDFHDVFIANQSFAELQGKKLSLKELQRYPIIMLDRKSTTSEFLHSLFQQHQLDLVPEIELSSNDLLIDLARIGLGIAFIPDYCVPKNSDQLFVVQTEEQLPKRQLVAAWNGHVPVSRATQAFLDYFNA